MHTHAYLRAHACIHRGTATLFHRRVYLHIYTYKRIPIKYVHMYSRTTYIGVYAHRYTCTHSDVCIYHFFFHMLPKRLISTEIFLQTSYAFAYQKELKIDVT